MQTVRTIVCKLAPTPVQIAEIDNTLVAFAAACDHIAAVSRREESTNRCLVHKACYLEVRARFGLSANLACRAIARACISLKVPDKANSAFDPTSIDDDQRIFRYHEADGSFGLTMLHGRARVAADLGAYQQAALAGRKPTSATLVKRRDGGYFLHV